VVLASWYSGRAWGISLAVVRRDLVIEDDAMVEESVIMDHTVIKKGCRLKRVIVDKFNVIAEGP
jgi:glucose-1-phosphate adenylyltransferase